MAVVTGSVKASSSFTQTANLPGTVTSATDLQNFNCNLANGTLADQCNLNYVATLAFTASTPIVLDLTALTDRYGAVVNFKRVKTITIKHKGTTSGWVLLLGYATTTANAWISLVSNPGQLTIYPSTPNNDGFITISAPGATAMVVGATNRLLNLDPGANAFSIDIEISGCDV